MRRKAIGEYCSRRSYLTMAGGATLLASGLAGCTDGGGTRTIGAAIPRSGDLSDFGDQFERQAGFALDIVNESEEQLNFDYEDTNTSENTGVTAADKLVNEQGYPMIFAGLSSSVAIAIAESVTIPNSTLQATGGTSSAITDLDDDGYVFRTSPASTFQARAMATLIANNDVSETAVIYLNDDFGTSFEAELSSSLETLGVTVTDSVPYEAGESTYSSQLNQATSGDPEGIAFVTFPQSFIVMIQEAYEMGIKDDVQYFGVENIRGAQVSDNVQPETIEGMLGTQPNPPTDKETYQQFIQDNEEQLDNTPSIWEAYYFDAAILMSLAATSVDSYESQTLRDTVYDISRPEGDVYTYQEFDEAAQALSNGDPVNMEGVATNLDLDENGDVIGTYRQWQFADGEFQDGDFIDVADELS